MKSLFQRFVPSAARAVPVAAIALTGIVLIVPAIFPALSDAAARKFRSVRFGPDLRLGGDAAAFQSEPAIAVNAPNPGSLVAGFIDYSDRVHEGQVRTVSSSDGGTTWSASLEAPRLDGRDDTADPSIASEAGGKIYHAYLEFGVTGSRADLADVVVARSDDGGRTFPTLSVAAAHSPANSLDKPYMAIDTQPRSRLNGNIYVAFMDFYSGVNIVVSRDRAATWSAPLLIGPFSADPLSLDQGPVPVVAPDGTVYVFYLEYRDTGPSPTSSILYTRSRDGGRTWGPVAAVASNLPSPGFFSLKNANPEYGTTSGVGLRVTSIPAAAIAPNGTIFVAWVDFPQGSCRNFGGSPAPCTNADVRLSVSKDDARSWSAPIKVSDDAGASDQFFPWIATHPDGLASLVWLDRRLDSRNLDYDVFYTNTYDGRAFLPNVRVNTLPSLVGTEFFIGDYQGIAASADGVFPVWNDDRSGSPAVFFARGTLGP